MVKINAGDDLIEFCVGPIVFRNWITLVFVILIMFLLRPEFIYDAPQRDFGNPCFE